MEAAISRSPGFLFACTCLSEGKYQQAYTLFVQMRDGNKNDRESVLELNRWIARVLELSGRKEEALAYLLEIEAEYARTGYINATNCHSIVILLNDLGRFEDLESYCSGIIDPGAGNALDHLSWIAQYAEISERASATPFMYKILYSIASQLGCEAPPINLEGENLRVLTETYIAQRNAASARYQHFWSGWRKLVAEGATTEIIAAHVDHYVRSEPCAIFRDYAARALGSQ